MAIWEQLVRELGQYPSVVLTGIGEDGYPYSVRLRPVMDAGRQVLRVKFPDTAAIQPGPASLLVHSYDDNTWNQTSVMVRDTLERTDEGWILKPIQLIPGFGRSPMAMMRLLRNSQRAAADYLAKRNLPRPQVDWDDVKALWAEVKSS